MKKTIILALMLMLIGCGKTEEENNLISALEKEFATIESGCIYELTENHFQPGLYHDFTEEELESWEDCFGKNDYKITQVDVQNVQIKYIIDLYDEEESEVRSLAVDEDYKVYLEEGYEISGGAFNDFFSELVQ